MTKPTDRCVNSYCRHTIRSVKDPSKLAIEAILGTPLFELKRKAYSAIPAGIAMRSTV